MPPAGSNPAVDKPGVASLDGMFLPDTVKASHLFAPLSVGGVTPDRCRVKPYSEGSQLLNGGNGISGSDETSEPSATRWTGCASAAPVPEPSSVGGAVAAAIALQWRSRSRR